MKAVTGKRRALIVKAADAIENLMIELGKMQTNDDKDIWLLCQPLLLKLQKELKKQI